MPISSVDFVVASPGSGGANLVGEVYTDSGDGQQKFIPFSGIVVGTQNGTYEIVGPSTSLPVALVGTVEIVDGGNSITVDGAVAATQAGDWYARLLDGLGNAIESGIATPADTARGLIVRNIEDANQGEPADLADAWPTKVSDGTDFATLTTIGSDVGLDVNVIGGIGGSSLTDKAIFTPGSDTLTMAGGTYRSARDNVGDGRGGAFAMTATRALYVSLETATGDPIADDTLNALRMIVIDSTGTQINSFGGGIEYTEGATDSSITGKAIMWEDASDTLRAVSAAKPLPVEIVSSSAGGTAMVDDAAFTFATTSFTPAGGVYNSSRDSVDSGDGGAFAMTPKRGQYVVLETPNGDSMAIESINALQVAIVDGAGTQITTFGGGFQYAEDSAHVSGDSGNVSLAVRRDANTSLVGTDGDYSPLQVDATGSLKVSIISGAGSGGTAMTDDAVFTVAVSNVTPAGATYRATRDSVDDGDIGAVAMTAKRGLLTSIETVNGDPVTNDTLNSVVMSCAFPTVVTGLCSGTGASTSLDTSELGTVGVTLSGTASSITAVFQVSNDGGTTWLNILGKRTTTGLFETGPVGMALSGTAASWQVSVAGYNRFRINFTAVSYTSLAYSIQGIAETFPGEGFSGTILDDSAFTFGANYIMAVGGVYHSTRDSLDSGDAGAIALNIKRGVFTTLEDSTGNAIVASTANPASGDLSLAVKLTPPSSNSVAYPMKITDGTTVAGVRDLTSSDALNVAIVDSTGAQISSLVHTEFAEDSAHANGALGNLPLTVRNDTNSSLVGANGDYAPLQVDATGLLKVNVVTSSSSGGGVSIVDDAAFTIGTSSLTPVGGTYVSGRDALDNGDSGAFAMTLKRALFVTPENSSATELTVVDNAAFTDGTTPVTPAGFVYDDVAGTALTENDAAAGRIDSKRAIVFALEDATTRGQRAAISSAGALSVSDTQVLVDNAAFTDGTTKVFAGGYIFDDVAGTALTENDIAAARIDSKRAQVLVLEDGTTRGQKAAVSATGALSVSDTQVLADNAAFTDGTTKVFAGGYVFDETAGTSLTENDIAAARIDSKRSQVLVIEDATTRGRRATVNSDGSISVQDVTAVSDDSAFTPGTTKVFPSAGTYRSVRDAVDDNDVGALAMTPKRGVYCSPETPNADSLCDDTANALKITGQVFVALAETAITANGQTEISTYGVAAGDRQQAGFLVAIKTSANTATSITIAVEHLMTLWGPGQIYDIELGYATTSLTLTGVGSAPRYFWVPATGIERMRFRVSALTLGSAASVQISAYAFTTAPSLNPPAPSIARLISGASTNLTTVKNSCAVLTGYTIFNNSTSLRYVKLYNTNSTSPATVGTTTPVATLMVPKEGGLNLTGLELLFTNGIQFAITGGIADSDTTSIAANEVSVNLLYR